MNHAIPATVSETVAAADACPLLVTVYWKLSAPVNHRGGL
jgi:hypothetical protein